MKGDIAFQPRNLRQEGKACAAGAAVLRLEVKIGAAAVALAEGAGLHRVGNAHRAGDIPLHGIVQEVIRIGRAVRLGEGHIACVIGNADVLRHAAGDGHRLHLGAEELFTGSAQQLC